MILEEENQQNIGKETNGKIKLLDLKQSSNILISGSTGSGKTMLLSSIICSILYKAYPSEVKLIIIDTKNVVEEQNFIIKILWWIFLFPVMLILFILKNNNLSSWKKVIIIIAIVWVTVFIFL